MWSRTDWRDFFYTVEKRWLRLRPPRPVDQSTQGRILPAAGFSLRELESAGISMQQAQALNLPVDVGRIGIYAPNISALRDYARASRVTG